MTGIICSMVGATFAVAAAAVVRAKKGLVAIGNAQIDTAQYKFGSGSGGSSILFDGTGDYLIVGNTVDNDLALTSTTWTVEYWARINAHAGAYQATVAIWDDVGSTGSVYYFTTNMYNGTQKMGFAYYKADNTDSGALSFGSALATGVWKHHAFVRNGNTLTAYLDGVSQGTHDMTGVTIDITGYNSSSNTSLKMTIGAMTGGGGAFNGWLDEIRISKTARYTTGFTAPTAAFVNDADTTLLIHFDGTDGQTVFQDDNGKGRVPRIPTPVNNAQIDTANSKFGGGSLYLDGVNDSLQYTESGLKPGNFTDYTLEFWFKSNSASATEVLVFQGVNTGGTNDYWQLYVTSTNLVFNYPSDTKVNAAVTRDTNWHHVALVKQGTSNAIYYDGTQVGSSWTFTDANWNATDNNTFYFGIQQGDTTDFTGWMDEIRISNSARYTANFTAPTQAFTNDANTLALWHFDATDALTVITDDNGNYTT